MNERSIFMAALALDTPGRRSAYLEEACGGDVALRQRVEALLTSHEQAGSFLSKPIPERLAENRATSEQASPATPLEPDGGACIGTVIGRYKLLQQIGEGGMGTVFLAEQQQPV